MWKGKRSWIQALITTFHFAKRCEKRKTHFVRLSFRQQPQRFLMFRKSISFVCKSLLWSQHQLLLVVLPVAAEMHSKPDTLWCYRAIMLCSRLFYIEIELLVKAETDLLEIIQLLWVKMALPCCCDDNTQLLTCFQRIQCQWWRHNKHHVTHLVCVHDARKCLLCIFVSLLSFYFILFSSLSSVSPFSSICPSWPL